MKRQQNVLNEVLHILGLGERPLARDDPPNTWCDCAQELMVGRCISPLSRVHERAELIV
jgi:hypothetical protein